MAFLLTPGPLAGLVLVQPRVHPDARGSFFESFKASEFRAAGLPETFHQDNHSVSHRGVLRGLHLQRPPHAQGKLIRAVAGAVWDVAVDLRPGSPSWGRWFGVELSAENRTQLYLPPGFAHGFLTLTESAEVLYKCTEEYDPSCEVGVRWDDPTLAIDWPRLDVSYRISAKDSALPFLPEFPA